MTTDPESSRGASGEDFEQDPAAGNGGTMGDGPEHDPGAANANRASHDGAQAAGRAATSSEGSDDERDYQTQNEAASAYDYLTSRAWGENNLFDILQLDPDEASEADVVAAHKRLLGLLHPDKGYVDDHRAAQVLNDIFAPWKLKRDKEHNQKVRDAQSAGEPKPRKTASKAKGSGKRFGGYGAPMPPADGRRSDSGESERDSEDFNEGRDDEHRFYDDFDTSFFGEGGYYGYRDSYTTHDYSSEDPWSQHQGEAYDEEQSYSFPGSGFGSKVRDFWQEVSSSEVNGRAARRIAAIFGPSVANFMGDFVGLGDASNIKATISANAAYQMFNKTRDKWDDMSRVMRGASAAGLGFLATNAFTGGYHERGNLFAAAAGVAYGATADSKASEWVRDNLVSFKYNLRNFDTGRISDKWNQLSHETRRSIAAGIGWFATAEFSNILDWPKGGFNHITAAASAAAVSGLTYGAFKLRDKWDEADDATRRKYKRNALIGLGTFAVLGAGFVVHKYGLPGFGGGKSGNHVTDQASGSAGRPRSGSTTTTLGERISTTTSAPNGSTSSTLTSTTVPSSVPRGGNGSAWTEIGSRIPSPGAGTGAGRSGGDTTKAMAEEAFKRAAKAQEHLAKLRAKKLGIKLNDEQAKKLIERRFSNLFTSKSENFNRFVNSSDKAKQAFTDFDLKQAAA